MTTPTGYPQPRLTPFASARNAGSQARPKSSQSVPRYEKVRHSLALVKST